MKKKIFIIGIGGKGLNGIAKICLEKGYDVSGVDIVKKSETEALEAIGAKIYYGHDENNIKNDIDLVVYSSIAKDSPEIKRAKELGIETIKRSVFLGFLTKDDFRICVSGSHGKSTTTALIGLSTVNSGIDSTIFGGAYTKEFSGYNHYGKSKYSIIEACEYDRSFYDLTGNCTIITSIEKSHMEYYKNEEEMVDAFKTYMEKHSNDARLFINGDSQIIKNVSCHFPGEIITFGFNPRNDYFITDVKKNNYSSVFSVYHLGEKLIGNLEINIPGDYNILNFATVIAVMNELKMPLDGICKTARTFMGVGRRFEVTQNKSGQTIIDDFAHHPTQVKNLFEGIRQFYPHKKVCAVFQPKQYNLIRNFLKEYGESFKKADEIILTDILATSKDTEYDLKSLTEYDLVDSIIKNSGKPVKLIRSFPEIVNYIKQNYGEKSVITTIGAGDIYKVRDELMR